MVACFTQLRSVKLHSLPPRVDVGEASVFWAAVQKAARWNETDAETLLGKVVDLASDRIVDGDGAIEALIRGMNETGLLMLVLGGKNLGKSFLKKMALQRSPPTWWCYQ